ncbi:exodeoxyribonuclease VII small subunit [Gemella sanguinis]|jgi:exodeoxyribonuclease VII, small subunit|uniref:Exodeoxyribonuclease 7 small subunit n=1 Tax=Gemella sanguinis TaxID=84135 RepID=A0ABX6FPL7_9BACL|nr:exodeoxyribonuclease VII small subunit [Gemella sanguinis]EGF85988.1 exodeoxyribonuclease VII, small subunit [Gemella sanguinis M325]QGS08227.1 exodeoxyribonuclease VII small subunit [Gemella sanguinis]
MAKENFESNLINLEKIVSELESGQLSLEESLEKYKKGIDLVKKCNTIIENAEKEVQRLTEDIKTNE